MYVDFESLPDHSRIWVYQCNRSFTEQELNELRLELEEFIHRWTAHGSGLKASYKIRYNRFIILAVDQDTQQATGCSIDASVHFIQQLEKKYQVGLLDKMNVSYKHGEHIAFKPLADFRKMAKNKSVSPKTIVFNNLVTNIAEYRDFWEVPAAESWHSRFF